MPWFCARGKTPSMCDQWTTAPRSMPVMPKTNPTSSLPSNAPVTTPPMCAAILSMAGGTTSPNDSPQVRRCRSTQARNSSWVVSGLMATDATLSWRCSIVLVSTVTALLRSVAKADELVLQRHRLADCDGRRQARALDALGAEAAAAHEVERRKGVRESLRTERRRAGRDAVHYMEVQV